LIILSLLWNLFN